MLIKRWSFLENKVLEFSTLFSRKMYRCLLVYGQRQNVLPKSEKDVLSKVFMGVHAKLVSESKATEQSVTCPF